MKEGWEIKKLGEVGTVVTGSTPSTKDEDNYSSKDYCFVKPGDISNETISLIQESEAYISEKAYSRCRKLPQGSVLTTCIGIIGKVGILKVDATCNQQINGIIPNKNCISSEFLAYSLISRKTHLQGIANAPVVPIINKKEFSDVAIPVPPLPEQEKIVAELDCLSGIIEKKKQQLKELDALAQSIFYEMFGDPVTNEKGWEVAPLKDSVIEMFLGPFGSALKTECYVNKNDSYCMVYEQKHAIKKTLALDTHYIDKEKFESLMRFEVHSGDFIMSCRGTIGEIYRLPNDAPMGIIHPSLMKIRIREDKYNPVFFVRLLSSVIKNENTNGNCVQMAVTAKELGARKPILPPLPLQQTFASKIEAIEKQKELIKQSINEVETLFNSRMQEYFG